MDVKGYVVVLVRSDGSEFASASTFETSTFSGFDLQESQRIRARDMLAREVMQAAMPPEFAEVIDTYRAKEIIGQICHRNKWRVIEIPIGHKE